MSFCSYFPEIFIQDFVGSIIYKRICKQDSGISKDIEYLIEFGRRTAKFYFVNYNKIKINEKMSIKITNYQLKYNSV